MFHFHFLDPIHLACAHIASVDEWAALARLIAADNSHAPSQKEKFAESFEDVRR
jgi:hypothetical protein